MYDSRYSDKLHQNKLKVNNYTINNATQTKIPASQPIDVVKFNDILAENKTKTSRRNLSHEGSSTKSFII